MCSCLLVQFPTTSWLFGTTDLVTHILKVRRYPQPSLVYEFRENQSLGRYAPCVTFFDNQAAKIPAPQVERRHRSGCTAFHQVDTKFIFKDATFMFLRPTSIKSLLWKAAREYLVQPDRLVRMD